LRAAALQILEAGNPEDVGLRELSRRVGISATAAYRHFSGKDDLMASVAIEGFHELTAALQSAVKGPDPAVSVGLAYLEFALAKRGLFRLMFGPLLAKRKTYPALHAAAVETFGIIERAGVFGPEAERREDTEAVAASGLIHGLASLFIENVVPARDAKRIAQQVLAQASRNPDNDSAGA
jgi:AcrR family transcriptional regulator